mmetsp:Transcript_15343/g.48340  ORF Transcript_15343/g.48340 Transcript_15343/m.48340 type:complete len:202 (-) Transcript_15343:434-1039(-)
MWRPQWQRRATLRQSARRTRSALMRSRDGGSRRTSGCSMCCPWPPRTTRRPCRASPGWTRRASTARRRSLAPSQTTASPWATRSTRSTGLPAPSWPTPQGRPGSGTTAKRAMALCLLRRSPTSSTSPIGTRTTRRHKSSPHSGSAGWARSRSHPGCWISRSRCCRSRRKVSAPRSRTPHRSSGPGVQSTAAIPCSSPPSLV